MKVIKKTATMDEFFLGVFFSVFTLSFTGIIIKLTDPVMYFEDFNKIVVGTNIGILLIYFIFKWRIRYNE